MNQSHPSYQPFDAVLIVSFGGPQGPQDVRPFLENILRGRPAPPGRIEAVVANYMGYNGISPITEITRRQAAGANQRRHLVAGDVDAGQPADAGHLGRVGETLQHLDDRILVLGRDEVAVDPVAHLVAEGPDVGGEHDQAVLFRPAMAAWNGEVRG